MRARLGSFADQVYPTIAFTWYSQAFQSKEALQPRDRVRKGICAFRGAGQWWWHLRFRVKAAWPAKCIRFFPFIRRRWGRWHYSRGRSGGIDFRHEIYRGLQWISDANETKKEMRDFQHNLVWRCVHPDPELSMKRMFSSIICTSTGMHPRAR